MIESPPSSTVDPVAAERAVLGALINHEHAWDKVSDLTPKDFKEAEHRLIFEVLCELERSHGMKIDLIIASATLRRHPKFEDYPNILDYLSVVVNENYSAERIEHYARIVRDRSQEEHLGNSCKQILAMLASPEGRTTTQILDQAEKLVQDVSDSSAHGQAEFTQIGEYGSEVFRQIEKVYDWRQQNNRGVPVSHAATGLMSFDNRIGGLQKGELVILAGRPGMGKTSLALNIAHHIAGGGSAGQEGAVVAMFSMEMSGKQLAERMISTIAQISQTKVRSGDFTKADFEPLESAIGQLKDPKLVVVDHPTPTPSYIRRLARRIKASHGNHLNLIVIDYLQLMTSDQKADNRNAELSNITRHLKAIAQELEVPVLCLSQLNRQSATGQPKLQDLRDSGAIEQDADMVMFIYADEEGADSEGISAPAKLQIAKNRNGPIFTIDLIFNKEITQFHEQSQDEYLGEVPPGSN